MKSLEEQLKKALDRYGKARAVVEEKYGNKCKKIRDELIASGTCTHSDKKDYDWHHGYGKYITGERCNLCDAVSGWKDSGRWTRPENVRSGYED